MLDNVRVLLTFVLFVWRDFYVGATVRTDIAHLFIHFIKPLFRTLFDSYLTVYRYKIMFSEKENIIYVSREPRIGPCGTSFLTF